MKLVDIAERRARGGPETSRAASRIRVRTSVGMSRENSTPSPSSSTCQPMTSSVPGQVCSPLGAEARPVALRADQRRRGAVAEQRGGDDVALRIVAVAEGERAELDDQQRARAIRVRPARARRRAPARARRRRSRARRSAGASRRAASGSRSISSASRLGVAMPVVETATIASIASIPTPARSRQRSAASAINADCMLENSRSALHPAMRLEYQSSGTQE